MVEVLVVAEGFWWRLEVVEEVLEDVEEVSWSKEVEQLLGGVEEVLR